MTGRDWAVAVFFSCMALTFFMIALSVANLFRVVTSLKDAVDKVTRETLPVISETAEAMRMVNKELGRVDSIVGSAQRVATNVEVISDTVQAAVTNPLVKALAFVAGARKAGRSLRSKD